MLDPRIHSRFVVLALLVIGASGCALAGSDRSRRDDGEPAYDPFFDGEEKRPKKGELPLVPIPTNQGRGGAPEGYPKGGASFGGDGRSIMTFFVASAPVTGNLGGLEGADGRCAALARAAGGGDHVWRAYLSASAADARDRIGPGPWTNHAGAVVAADVASLHDPASGLAPAALDENGGELPRDPALPVLTGSRSDGTAAPETCQDWTADGPDDVAQVGAPGGVGWNAAATRACALASRLYCFAME